MPVLYSFGYIQGRAEPQSAIASQKRAVAAVAASNIEFTVNFAIIKHVSQVRVIQDTNALHLAEKPSANRVWQCCLWMDEVECYLSRRHSIFLRITLSFYSMSSP